MMNLSLPAEDDLHKQFMLGVASALFLAWVCYLAISLYQLGFAQGVQNAAQKRTVAVHHFPKHSETHTRGAQTETGGSDSRELCAASETKEKEPA